MCYRKYAIICGVPLIICVYTFFVFLIPLILFFTLHFGVFVTPLLWSVTFSYILIQSGHNY